MELQQFWTIIAAARHTAGDDFDDRVDALKNELEKLTPEQIQDFQTRYDELIVRAYRWDLWGAAWLMNGGCSDDGFRYFCDWLISEGQDTFERALADPDSLAELPEAEYFELESYGYAAWKAYEAKSAGEPMRNSTIDLSTPKGREWEEDELPSLLPHLSEMYLG